MGDHESHWQFGGDRRKRLVVNVAPLIDIVFLLLVFFMLTTSFLERHAVALRLPEAATTPSENKPIILRVFADGRFGDADHRILSPVQLGLLAIGELEADPQRRFRIASDRQAPVQATLEVMDILRGAGVKNLHFFAPQDRDHSGLATPPSTEAQP